MVRGNITTWMGREDHAVLAHLHVPAGEVSGAVVLCPPLGREQVASYRALRQLGDALARKGLVAVRFAWTGQGDSAPLDDSMGLLANWQADLEAVVRQLRADGVGPVHLAGLRLGAMVAARAAVELHPASLLLWDPVDSGRKFLRQEQLMYTADGLSKPGDGDFHALGYSLRASDADELRALRLAAVELPEVTTGRILRGEKGVTEPGADGTWTSDEMPAMLETSSMTAHVPVRTLASITAWYAGLVEQGQHRPAAGYSPTLRPSTVMGVAGQPGAKVREEVVELPTGLPGILTSPLHGVGDLGVLYVAASSEPLDGPSGLWALSAREVAADGGTGLRIDKHGTGELGGELPTDPLPYMPGFTEDVGTAARWLTERTGGRPLGVGLCSGVYFEMTRPNAVLFRKIVGINLLAFDRDPADIPDEVAMATDPNHLTAGEQPENPSLKQRLRMAVKTGIPQPLWRQMGRVGLAHAPDDFLREAAMDTELVLAFSPDDHQALSQQRGEAAIAWARRTGAPLQVLVDDELDHGLFGAPGRRRCLEIIRDEVRRTRRLAGVAQVA